MLFIPQYIFLSIFLLSCLNVNNEFSYKNINQSFDKIVLNESMILNETVYGDASKLVDEQSVVGSPALGNGEKPKSTWTIPYNRKDFLPFSAVIDLGQYYYVSEIFIYDAEGKGELIVSSGVPFKWKQKVVEKLENYQKWKKHSIEDTTRFIQIKLNEMVSTPEIVLYGTPVPIDKKIGQNAKLKKKANNSSRRTMDELIGVNAFIDDPIDNIKVGKFVREYHSWSWDEDYKDSDVQYPINKNAWAPSYAGGGSWNFDQFYAKLKEEGSIVVPCIQGSVNWIPGGHVAKPVPEKGNSLLPSSYIAHADHMFQYVARYGSKKVASPLLKLRTDQEKISGLGLIQYYENWNEPNNDWSESENYFSPYEFAAMCSADYDGHLNSLGETIGVKNADPSAKMVMGGIASFNLDYLRSIKFWAMYNRNGSLPFDVLNFHHYSNNRDRPTSNIVSGISPEADSLLEQLTRVINYRDNEMPNKEVWFTEFGYDTHPNSPQRAPKIGDMNPEEVQAAWLLRSFLAIAAAGIDRAAMFMLRDVNPDNSTKYQTSGLTTSKKNGFEPKRSWYYLSTLKNQLTGMIFDKVMVKSAYVYLFRFKHPSKKEYAYVIWAPTSDDRLIKNYELSFEHDDQSQVELIKFADKKQNGISEQLNIEKGKITLDVSETPQIIKVTL